MKVVVDRIENSLTVLVPLEDDSGYFSLPVALLPDVKEGDILDFTITRDTTATQETRDRVTRLISRLQQNAK
ncbi:MAG: DUF3006 domain-containing protein [Methanoregulaceae archaeon]